MMHYKFAAVMKGNASSVFTQNKSMDWDGLVEALTTPRIGTKDGPYFVRGVLTGSRKDANMVDTDVGFIVLDGDVGIDAFGAEKPNIAPPLERVHEVLTEHEISHIAYTTHSTGELMDDGKEKYKWRVVIPVHPDHAAKWRVYQDEILTILDDWGVGIKLVEEMKKLSNPWYFPRVEPDRENLFEHYSHQGQCMPYTKPDLVLKALGGSRGLNDDGFHDVSCPWADEHTSGGDGGRYTEPSDQNNWRGGYSCFHTSHGAKTINDVAEFYGLILPEPKPIPASVPNRSPTAHTLCSLAFCDPILDKKDVFNKHHLLFTEKGEVRKVMGTVENMVALLAQYGIEVVYNEVTHREMFAVNGVACDNDDAIIDQIASLCELNKMPKVELVPRLRGVAQRFKYNPVLNYLEGLTTELAGAIDCLADYVTVNKGSKKLFRKMLRLWMIQCCAAADKTQRTPNRKAIPRYEHILVFSSAQGVQKTKFFRSLAQGIPGVFKDGLMLNPTKTDSITQATGLWIAELGEIDSTFKKDKISELKAFLSNTEDIYRLPYARASIVEQRHTSYCGTVNDLKFLRDATGNRRYWSFEVLKIKLPGQDVVDAAWSEAWAEYLAGERWWAGKKLEKQMRKHTCTFEEVPDAVQDVLEHFKPATGNNGKWLSAKELLSECGYDFSSGYMPPRLRQQVDGYLRKDGWKSKARSRMTFWYVC